MAALLPIVAGIGGNSGNQTITMIVRSLAMGQLNLSQSGRLLRKELGVALLNGIIWGSVMGVVSYLLYGSIGIGLVMVTAMTLNLVLAATMGVLIPVIMEKFGRDPALGSSVLITAVTDSGGFMIFLGLATIFLLRARYAIGCCTALYPNLKPACCCNVWVIFPARIWSLTTMRSCQ